MRIIKIARLLLFLALPLITSAQVVQINNCHFNMVGNVKMVLRNAGMINNGSFEAGASRVIFTGNRDVRIGGNRLLLFNDVTVSKTDGKALLLEASMGVRGILGFASGFITLSQRNNLNLGFSGSIENERNGSRITGSNGGVVSVNRIVNNSSVPLNPGNIGVEISMTPLLPPFTVLIQRHHVPMPMGDSLTAIRRVFNVFLPEFVGINGTIKFHYFSSELNGANESALSLWKIVPFDFLPVTTIVDTAANTLTATGLTGFGSFTAASPDDLSILRSSEHINGKTDPSGTVAFPNPAHDRFTLQMTSKQVKNITLRLYDQSGRVLQEKRMSMHIGTNIIPWNISAYAAGAYYISSENNEVKNIKVIKE